MQRSTASPARAPALSRIHASRQHPIETQQLIDRFLLQKRSHGFICRNSASHCDAHRAKDSKAQGFRTCGHSREKLPALRDSNSFSPASEGPAGPGSYYASAVGPGTGCPGSGTWIALARGTRAGAPQVHPALLQPPLSSRSLSLFLVLRALTQIWCRLPTHVLIPSSSVSLRLWETRLLLLVVVLQSTYLMANYPIYRSIQARNRRVLPSSPRPGSETSRGGRAETRHPSLG